jgi:hypothetical protein
MKTFYEIDLQASQRKPYRFNRWDETDPEEYEKYCFHTDTVDKILLISYDNKVTEVSFIRTDLSGRGLLTVVL